MSETNDYFELMRRQLAANLKILFTQEFIRKSKQVIEINPDTFKRFDKIAFQLISYHLLNTLDAKECQKRFRGCYPVNDRKQEAEFRKVVYEWIKELSEKETNPVQFPRVLPIYFQNFSPEPVFCQLYLVFTNYVIADQIKRMSSLSAGVELSSLLASNDGEVAKKNFSEYDVTKDETKRESEDYLEQMRYFVETHVQLCHTFEGLRQKAKLLEDSLRKKYSFKNDLEAKRVVSDYLNRLKSSINQMEEQISELNKLAESSDKSYSIVFASQTKSSELSIDLSKWFTKKSKSFQSSANYLNSELKRIDLVLQKVLTDSLTQYSDYSDRLLKEIHNYKTKEEESYAQMDSLLNQLQTSSSKLKAKLLAEPEMKERRKWFAERVTDMSKLRLRLELKPLESEKKDSTPEVVNKERLLSTLSDDSPNYRPRQSLLDYSFQVMDISTCQYIPPTNCPLAMNDSHLFSPIDDTNDK